MMNNLSSPTVLEMMEAAAETQAHAHYLLKLCISGTTPSSAKAIVNIRKICEEHLQGIKSKARLAIVFEEVNVGFWDWDLDTDKYRYGSTGNLYLACSDLDCDLAAIEASTPSGGKSKSSIKTLSPRRPWPSRRPNGLKHKATLI
jgi:hypothetical protein